MRAKYLILVSSMMLFAAPSQAETKEQCLSRVQGWYSGLSPDNYANTNYYFELSKCDYYPSDNDSYWTQGQNIGYWQGSYTFGDLPTRGVSNGFYPNGRINSGRPGGIYEAYSDLGYISSLNSIVPPAQVGTPVGNAAGWTYRTSGANQIVTHFTGLEFRANGISGQINIDIPQNMFVGPNVRNTSGYIESVHYNSGYTPK